MNPAPPVTITCMSDPPVTSADAAAGDAGHRRRRVPSGTSTSSPTTVTADHAHRSAATTQSRPEDRPDHPGPRATRAPGSSTEPLDGAPPFDHGAGRR